MESDSDRFVPATGPNTLLCSRYRESFVFRVARQEVFGVADMMCVLASQSGSSVYPESAFFVQVKSDRKPLTLDADQLRWMSRHMNHPLFVCAVEKSAGGSISMYSSARLWEALFLRSEPSTVTLLLEDEATKAEAPTLQQTDGKVSLRFDSARRSSNNRSLTLRITPNRRTTFSPRGFSWTR